MKYAILLLVLMVGCAPVQECPVLEPLECPECPVLNETVQQECPVCGECEECKDFSNTTDTNTVREHDLLMELLRCEDNKVTNMTTIQYTARVDNLEKDRNDTLEAIEEIRVILERID